jgi:hypothetical protein
VLDQVQTLFEGQLGAARCHDRIEMIAAE